MSCITKLLELKGDKDVLPIHEDVVIEGGGTYKEYEYLITFTARGTRCAYVALKPEEAERFNEEKGANEYYYPDLDCHGGITFFGSDHSAKSLLPVYCEDTWVGFDAAHAWDLEDMETAERYFPEGNRYVQYRKENPMPDFGDSFHRSYEYMEKECHSIIDQLRALHEDFEESIYQMYKEMRDMVEDFRGKEIDSLFRKFIDTQESICNQYDCSSKDMYERWNKERELELLTKVAE